MEVLSGSPVFIGSGWDDCDRMVSKKVFEGFDQEGLAQGDEYFLPALGVRGVSDGWGEAQTQIDLNGGKAEILGLKGGAEAAFASEMMKAGERDGMPHALAFVLGERADHVEVTGVFVVGDAVPGGRCGEDMAAGNSEDDAARVKCGISLHEPVEIVCAAKGGLDDMVPTGFVSRLERADMEVLGGGKRGQVIERLAGHNKL